MNLVESSIEATSTIKESYNMQHAAAEETFDPLSDSIETNVAFVIEDSTVASPCMATTSTIQESYNMQHAATEENFDPLSDSIETNLAVVIEDSTVASPCMESTSTIQESCNMQHAFKVTKNKTYHVIHIFCYTTKQCNV